MVRVVLDSNEYVFYIMGLSDVVEFILNAGAEVCVHTAIIEEVWRNLMAPAHKTAFLSILLSPDVRIYTDKLPRALREEYARLGLRGGDILIAAFTEFCHADILVTEDTNFGVLKGRPMSHSRYCPIGSSGARACRQRG